MQRDMDLIRKILFAIEEKYVDTWLPGSDVQIDGYDMKTIAYHCALLHDAGLIYDYKTQYAGDGLYFFGVGRLTWEGHELLDKSRVIPFGIRQRKLLSPRGYHLSLMP